MRLQKYITSVTKIIMHRKNIKENTRVRSKGRTAFREKWSFMAETSVPVLAAQAWALLIFIDCFFEKQSVYHQHFISFRGGLTGYLKLVPSPFTWGHNRSLLVLVSAFFPRRISFAFLQFSSLDEFLVWWSRVRVKVRYGRFKRKKNGNELFN